MAANFEEYWLSGTTEKDFLNSRVPKHYKARYALGSLSILQVNGMPDDVQKLLSQKRIRRNRTLDGLVFSNATLYSFHSISVIRKTKLRGTDVPTSVHLIVKHKPKESSGANSVVFVSTGYSSHHNYFSMKWTDELLHADNNIRVTLKKSGEQLKIFHFPENGPLRQLRQDIGPYVLGTKGSFNQQSPYVLKARKALDQRRLELLKFMNDHNIETIFTEMMIGDQHVYKNPEGTPPFFVHGIRDIHGKRLNLFDVTIQNAVRNCGMDVVGLVNTFHTFQDVLEFFQKELAFSDVGNFYGEEGFYAHDDIVGAVKFKLPEYLVRREMREARRGPVMTVDHALAYVSTMFPKLTVGNLCVEIPESQKLYYARWIHYWCVKWAHTKIFNSDKAEEILTGNFIGALDELESEFKNAKLPVSLLANKILTGIAEHAPVVYIIMLTGPPGSGKSSRVRETLRPYDPLWLTQDEVGDRRGIVEAVVNFAELVYQEKNGIFPVVIDRCNPSRLARKRILDEIREKYRGRGLRRDIMWVQHVNIHGEADPDKSLLQTLVDRVMTRENHPTLGPSSGMITVTEVISNFLESLEPALDAVDIRDSQYDALLQELPVEQFKKIDRSNYSAKKIVPAPDRLIKLYAGILIFDEMPDVPVGPEKKSVLETWNKKTVLHSTLRFFGRHNFPKFMKSVQDGLNTSTLIYDMCLSDPTKPCKVAGKVLGFYMNENLGVAGYMVQFFPLIDNGIQQIYHVTVFLKEGASAVDSNKVLLDENRLLPLTTKDIGNTAYSGDLYWFSKEVLIKNCYASFATTK